MVVLERVRRSFARMLPGQEDFSFRERVDRLRLHNLEEVEV